MFDSQQTTMAAGGAWMVGKNLAVGGLFSGYSLGIDEVNEDGLAVGTVDRSCMGAGVSSAMRFGMFAAGVTAKFVSDGVAGNEVSTVAGDLGLAASSGRWGGGIAVRNLGGGLRSESGISEGLPMEMRAGGSFLVREIRTVLAVEFTKGSEENEVVGGGAEWWPTGNFALRGGADVLGSGPLGITFGLSAVLGRLGLDYAASLHELGMSHVACLSFGFGPVVREPWAGSGDFAIGEALFGSSKEEEARPARTAAVPGKKLNVAVADLAPQNASRGDAALIGDLLRGELVKARRFTVIEKQNMDKVLAEQAFQQTGCTSDECAVKLGKLLNAQRLVMGSFGKLLSRYFISIRVVDIETGKIIYSDEAKGDTVDDLEKSLKKMTVRIVAAIE
jgi:TolB-like protein